MKKPGKCQQLHVTYNVPHDIYSIRGNKAAAWHNATLAVENFNAMNIPELNHQGSKGGIPAGSEVSTLNKSDSQVLFVMLQCVVPYPPYFPHLLDL